MIKLTLTPFLNLLHSNYEHGLHWRQYYLSPSYLEYNLKAVLFCEVGPDKK